MCKMCNLKTELANLNHTVENNTLVDMLLESLPDQIEFERLKSSIYYDADPSIYTAARVRKLILAASARQKEFRGRRCEKEKKGRFRSETYNYDVDRGDKYQNSAREIKEDSHLLHMWK